ncbi:MAG TPA: Xaa-Pro peptidase family protein [Thermoanaerobaculia bacterium]|jgi:Xaa-Pro dipeptidase|nr:Xaa-Pro peptidase family protein [Thermoanaerobaculia bacterium]
MPTKPEIYLRRLETVRTRTASLRADGLFATPSSNLFYLTGVDFHRSERLTALLLFQDREPVVICPAFEASRLRLMSAVKQVVTWEETEDPYAKAAALFPGAAGTLAIEPSTAFDDVERLLASRPGWKPVSAAATFGALRMVKSSEELEMMRHAVSVALPRFRKAFGALKPGCTESEISALVGGENMVQFGPSSAYPHGASGSAPLSRDQAVLIDAWDKPDGYFYDITRSTYYGTPTDEYRTVWSIVLDAQSAAIEKAAPGVPCSEVDAAARRVIEKAGYGEFFTHRLGHGLGIDVHEAPYMVGHDRTVLEPGMTFTSEPGIYLPGRFGVRIEDDIVCTERGAESLSPRVTRLEPIAA